MGSDQIVLGENIQVAEPVRGEEPVIFVRNLTKTFDQQVAVKDISFEIPPGIIFGFVGPSGSGKTTTVRMLTGIYAPTEGEVKVLGYTPNKLPRHVREQIGYMPQLFFLYPQLTVWENLNFVASLYGMNLFRRKILHELLDFVELSGDENKLVQNLSGGMRRRLSLATTLVQDPKLIFLDEPTAGIDPVLRKKVWDHFEGLKESGKTMFVTTQYIGEVTYCDLVGVMNEGELIMVDTPDQIRYRTYGGDIIDVRADRFLTTDIVAELEHLPFVKRRVRSDGANVRLIVEEGNSAIPDLMEWFRTRNIEVETVEEYLPPFDDVFVELIQQKEPNV